jgi:hypothetical protein
VGERPVHIRHLAELTVQGLQHGPGGGRGLVVRERQ